MTDAERLDAYDHAKDFLAEDNEKHYLSTVERTLCQSIIDMNSHIVDLQSKLDTANQTIDKYMEHIRMVEHRADDIWEQDQLMRETLERIDWISGSNANTDQFLKQVHEMATDTLTFIRKGNEVENIPK